MELSTLSDDDIIDEVRKIQYLYGLKHVIRYGEKRHDGDDTESVAEHIYGMHLLALYFLNYEDRERKWDHAKIFSLITTHDLDEVETGDVIGYRKTEAQRVAETDAIPTMVAKSPLGLQTSISALLQEYNERRSPEALFVRAIDKFEPLVQLYTPHGKVIQHREQSTLAESKSIKDEHVKPFPSLRRFTEVLHARMVAEGYFC